jgi:alkanesulfonate monooxygenase SsuD/methylene tetrahydromethanopterin reductase-like flavin-dependent oxidoreductase (luciferase family)
VVRGRAVNTDALDLMVAADVLQNVAPGGSSTGEIHMQLGVHLPLADFGDGCPSAAGLRDYVLTAREAGFDTVAANDHLRWRRPWLDGPTALAAVAAAAGSMTLATTVALPVVRHPAVLAAALTSLAALHPGSVVAGIGPGSTRADYDVVGVPFEERWSRFDAAARDMRRLFADRDRPGADRPPPQLWYASWGSHIRLRALVSDADGWIASGYNATPSHYAATRAALDGHLRAVGRDPSGFPDMIATMWMQITDSAGDQARVLEDILGPALARDPQTLGHLPVGPPEHCVQALSAYAAAGARRVLLWPISDGRRQLRRYADEVAPHLTA